MVIILFDLPQISQIEYVAIIVLRELRQQLLSSLPSRFAVEGTQLGIFRDGDAKVLPLL
jgi:hypothetical protein